MKKIVISLMALLVGVEANAAGVRGAANGRYMSAQGSNYRVPGSPTQQQLLNGAAGTVKTNTNANTSAQTNVSGTTTTNTQTNTTKAEDTNKTDAAAAESDVDQEYVDEIKARYVSSYNRAKAACPGISENLSKIKVMAGITTGASGVGVVGGGAAAVSGFMKSANDSNLVSDDDYTNIMSAKDSKTETGEGSDVAATKVTELLKKVTPDYDAIVQKSENMRTIRTVGSFAAGGADAIGATTSFIALSQFDDLVEAMDACSDAVAEIEKEKNELSYALPEDPIIPSMTNIVTECSGLDSRNVSDIKGKLTASGVIVAISAATGIAGGITSMSNKPNMDTASNILAVATTAGSLAGVVTSALTLSALNKNSNVANSCQELF